MNESTPQAKVLKALHSAARVQSTVSDPRLKIEAAMWQMFFELPLSTLLEIRESAISPKQTELVLETAA